MTLGRYVDGVGGVHFVPLREATPGAANADPAVGPVVITEIMYHAGSSTDVEYVELQNTSDANVTLYDFARRLPWRFTGGREEPSIELLLPQEPPITMPSRGRLLLVKDRACSRADSPPPPRCRSSNGARAASAMPARRSS